MRTSLVVGTRADLFGGGGGLPGTKGSPEPAVDSTRRGSARPWLVDSSVVTSKKRLPSARVWTRFGRKRGRGMESRQRPVVGVEVCRGQGLTASQGVTRIETATRNVRHAVATWRTRRRRWQSETTRAEDVGAGSGSKGRRREKWIDNGWSVDEGSWAWVVAVMPSMRAAPGGSRQLARAGDGNPRIRLKMVWAVPSLPI